MPTGRPISANHKIRVDVDVPVTRKRTRHKGVRKFIVEYDADGNVLRVKEIKETAAATRHQNYWKAGTHPLGNGDTLIKRILAAAAAKRTAEDRSIDATP